MQLPCYLCFYCILMCLSVCRIVDVSMNLSIYRSIDLGVELSMKQLIKLSVDLFIICLCMRVSVYFIFFVICLALFVLLA